MGAEPPQDLLSILMRGKRSLWLMGQSSQHLSKLISPPSTILIPAPPF